MACEVLWPWFLWVIKEFRPSSYLGMVKIQLRVHILFWLFTFIFGCLVVTAVLPHQWSQSCASSVVKALLKLGVSEPAVPLPSKQVPISFSISCLCWYITCLCYCIRVLAFFFLFITCNYLIKSLLKIIFLKNKIQNKKSLPMWLWEGSSMNVLPGVLASGILLFPEEITGKKKNRSAYYLKASK